jgi:methyl-accepting chemotaxis protein
MTIGKRIVIGFVIAGIVPIVLGLLALRSIDGLMQTSAWVAHTQAVIAELEGVASHVGTLDAAGRGYALTGDETYLTAQEADARTLHDGLDSLRRLVADNDTQLRRIERLEPMVEARIDRIREVADVRRAKGLADAAAEVATGKGRRLTEDVSRVLDEMRSSERELLDARTREAAASASATSGAIVVGMLLAVLVVLIASIMIVRSITVPVRLIVSQLTTTSSELLAGTTEQAAGAQQQATAVTQTVSTVDEVTQTAAHSARGAQALGEKIQRSLEIGQSGRRAVDGSVAATEALRRQIESTAESILTLSGQAQSIGDIIASVNDIAEQTNILALNASIEASRAGEHGRGFAVVAAEVRALAEMSKKSTAQVRRMLSDVQRSTNAAVVSIEDVTKGVANTGRVAAESGETIQALGAALAEASQVGAQIVASAGQQATGMAQIHQAMRSLDQVAKQNMAATRQAEQAARNLSELGSRLTIIVGH